LTGDPNCHFVEAPALAPPEINMDKQLMAENEAALEAANKTLVPDDNDEDL